LRKLVAFRAAKYLVPTLHVYRNHPMWQFSIIYLPALPRRLASVSLSPHIAFGQVLQDLMLQIFSAWAPDGKARCQYSCPRRSSNSPVHFTQTGSMSNPSTPTPPAKPYVWGTLRSLQGSYERPLKNRLEQRHDHHIHNDQFARYHEIMGHGEADSTFKVRGV
jgi:hypothetical protein